MIKGFLVKPEFVFTGTVCQGIRTNCYYFFLADGNRLERQGSRQTVTTFPVGEGRSLRRIGRAAERLLPWQQWRREPEPWKAGPKGHENPVGAKKRVDCRKSFVRKII